MSLSREEQALLAARIRAQRPPPVVPTSGIMESYVTPDGTPATSQPSTPVYPVSGVAESYVAEGAVSPQSLRTVVIGGRGRPEERLQALIDVAPYVPISEPTPKTVVIGGRGRAEERYFQEYDKWASLQPPPIVPVAKTELVGGRGYYEERLGLDVPVFSDRPQYLNIHDVGLQNFIKQWVGGVDILKVEGPHVEMKVGALYDMAMAAFKLSQKQAFTASVESWSFYNRLGFPQYGSKYAPFEIPEGLKVWEIKETATGLNVSFLPADMTPEEYQLFQKIEEVKFAGSIAFYEGLGYPGLAGKYETFKVPAGFAVAGITETAEGLSVAFKSLVEAPTSLSEQLYGGKVPSLGLRQTMLGDLDKYLVVGKTSELPWKLVGGLVGSFEAPVYSVGKLLGIQGLPNVPPGFFSGVVSSFTFKKSGLGLFEKGLISAEGMSQADQKMYATMREVHAPPTHALNVGFTPSAELKQVISLGPEYAIGSLLGDVAVAYLFGKAIQKVGSAVAKQVEGPLLKTYRAESYSGFTKGQMPFEGKLSFSKFISPSESGEPVLGRFESWLLRRGHPELAVGQVSIPVGEVYEGGKYLVRPETLAATDIGWGLTEAPRMGGIMVTKVPTETVLKGLPVYFGLGTELMTSGMAYEETFMFKGGKEATTKPFETVKPLGGFEKLPYTTGYEGSYGFQRSILPTASMLLKEPAQRSALETAFLKQFLSQPFTGSVTHSYAWAYWLTKEILQTYPRMTIETPRTTVAAIEKPQTIQKQVQKLASPLFAEVVQGFVPYAEQKGQLNLVQYAGKPYPGTARYAEEWLGFEVLHYPGQALTPQRIEATKTVSKVSPSSALVQDVWSFDKELQRHWMRQAQKPVVPLEQQVKQLPIQIGTGVVTPDVKAFESLKEFDRTILLPRIFVSGRYKPMETVIPISSLELMQKQAAKLVQVRGIQRGFYGGIPEGRPRPPSKFLPEESEFKKRFGMKTKKMEYPYRRYERFWPVMSAKQAVPYLFGKSTYRKRRRR